ncbi:MAG: DUF2073 domain-containing protein [Methanocellales archaeon]|nr:DUF2073 domain-containing protein [Methanocellales archaeon]MDD3291741.1 DUF2073 domain-containing protein [Methanocellales archaeon]MDD5235091.1 DUF2073 domain-containing protein [Methanocellales archaeon]MDD5485229.1 DUF2073 domain-containing protein [Methanocellales archaeon]
MAKKTKGKTKVQGVQIDMISEDFTSAMTSMEKINLILEGVRKGNIVILERGLTPEEEAKLIEITMAKITPDNFVGIEIESYPSRQKSSFLDRLLGKKVIETRLTVVGPADQLKTLRRDHGFISAMVSVRSQR